MVWASGVVMTKLCPRFGFHVSLFGESSAPFKLYTTSWRARFQFVHGGAKLPFSIDISQFQLCAAPRGQNHAENL